ncbi:MULTISPECIES: hypothetical protein [unclassified Streptomyces]|uniref:hypothetical protein n=1 Tax=unclassified Streptomyces TaxID=2593676 RepID=UPI003428B87A
MKGIAGQGDSQAATTRAAAWYATEPRRYAREFRSRIIVFTYGTVPAKYSRQ